MRSGAQSEINSAVSHDQARLIEDAPGVARDAGGRPLMSAELYLVVDGVKRSTGTTANLPLRGIGAEGAALRSNIRIVEGRMFASGSNEIVVGRNVTQEFSGFELGHSLTFGTSRWTVVGVFDAQGSVFESELWADAAVVQSLFNRSNYYQTIRVRLLSPNALAPLNDFVQNDPRLKLDVKSEPEYFAEQASRTSDLIQKLGWPLAIAMALGALAGALNTMYSSVASRAQEIATLRAIGFGGFPAFFGTLAEAMVLAALGGVIGAVATFLCFDGLKAATLTSNFTQVVFSFELTPRSALEGIGLALSVGLLGGAAAGFARRADADRRRIAGVVVTGSG